MGLGSKVATEPSVSPGAGIEAFQGSLLRSDEIRVCVNRYRPCATVLRYDLNISGCFYGIWMNFQWPDSVSQGVDACRLLNLSGD
jgi:hypothetical protein